MTIEEELFRKIKIDFDKISEYGFKKEKSLYKYSKNIMNNTFRVDIEINNDGIVKGKVYDLAFGDEYTNFRIEDSTGSFVGQVRDEFTNLLKDIRNNCFTRKSFIYEQSNRITKAINEKYGDEPEFEWEKFPGYATFRNKDSRKWYGIIMNVDKNKLDGKSNGEVEIIDIKLEPNEIESLLKQDGFYPAYHMNKKSWITIILDNTIADEKIMRLIEKSHSYTITNKNSAKNEWIVPANPKYFDIDKALKENNTIMWKQSTDIKVNDIVYIYVGKPYSSIMYKFKVVEVNIPYEYKDENLKMQKVMKIDLITKYEKGKLSFNKLKEFGVNAIRSQRYMPLDLSEYINKSKMIKRYKSNEIEELSQILKNDGIISVPTDTVFGICARMNSKIAYNKLIEVKKRPANKSFPVMCADEEQIKSIAIVNETAEKIIKAFMPGPITIVLNKNNILPECVTNGKDTIAVRMATSESIKELIKKTESPIFMTSANQSGKPECTNLDEIKKACPLLDGMMEGQVSFSIASTIVDCTSDEVKILREGPISLEQIKKVIDKK